jgi:hypothetical protein
MTRLAVGSTEGLMRNMRGLIMRKSRAWLAGLVCGGVVLGSIVARADPPPNVQLDMPSFLKAKKKPGLPDPKPQPLAWPRLDPGAVLCRTEADLARLAANRSGEEGGGPADCRVIPAATAVSIVQRKGPGRTEVKIGADDTTGWTDVWLPEKAPATARATPASQQQTQ